MTEVPETVLWVDDDSGKEPFAQADVTIKPASTLKEATEVLEALKDRLVGVIVDIRIPQDGWGGKKLFEYPGIQYVKHLRSHLPSTIPIVVYGVALDAKKRQLSSRAGADATMQKGTDSLVDVVETLRTIQRADATVQATDGAEGRR